MLSDEELLRYSRQILMPAFDVAGQRRLKAAHVLVVGAGGLGCPVALYLGAAGIGRLTLVDDDVVELANLQRQVAFIQDDLGQSKAEVLAARVRRINPGIEAVLPAAGELSSSTCCCSCAARSTLRQRSNFGGPELERALMRRRLDGG